MALVQVIRNGLSATALVVAVSCFGASFTPSLMPRDPLIQAALAAVAASLGYEAAMLVRALWRYMEIPDIKGRFLWVWWATATHWQKLRNKENVFQERHWQEEVIQEENRGCQGKGGTKEEKGC